MHIASGTHQSSTAKRLSILFGLMLVMVSTSALDGGGGQEFDEVWIILEDWTQGTLGRIISLSIILVGACAGVVRQSLMTFAVGFAMGMGLYNAPTILDAIMSATLPVAQQLTPTIQLAQQISNGLGS